MSEESERWEKVQGESRSREPFRAKASPVALHTDAARRRNMDKEEAARDRMIFSWVLLVLGIAGLLATLLFVMKRLGE
jgi:hypothetical protein